MFSKFFTTWRFLLDETGCSGKFLRHFMTIRFALSICNWALFCISQTKNYLVYIRTLYWLCTLVYEIYFSTLKHEAILNRVFTEKHPYTIKRQLYLRNLIEKVESVLKRMRWKAHFVLKRWKKSRKHQSFRPFVQQNTSHHFGIKTFRGRRF